MHKKTIVVGAVFVAILLTIIAVPILALCIRLDFVSGSHRIIPTAVDTTICGNYKVYYRTSQLTRDEQEKFYSIDKSRPDLAEQMRQYISEGKEVVISYDKHIGIKSLCSPVKSPITKIELLKE